MLRLARELVEKTPRTSTLSAHTPGRRSVPADLLGLSRPTLVKMIKAGEIKAHMVGSHRRLKLADVLDFQRDRLEQQQIAFDRLRELERTIAE
ncbi:excisionase family DNA-binding protein [Microlunatus parietis]|uniref:Excisionase family DNA binding protein n=1 Tax=Microlunatus parietis TaxID=682979 RepID=A0A7Y9I9M4_9ACTN|nr:excisionase family DNA-binding protein [Microlunatus parietis]NYE72578.1 excisionase family DNA binding protein [Microlunatus parietis]